MSRFESFMESELNLLKDPWTVQIQCEPPKYNFPLHRFYMVLPCFGAPGRFQIQVAKKRPVSHTDILDVALELERVVAAVVKWGPCPGQPHACLEFSRFHSED